MSELAIGGGTPVADSLTVPEWPILGERSREYVDECLESGRWCRNTGGPWCDRLEEEFAAYHDAKYAVAVSNGTTAIELALRACGVMPGDEVVVPSYSFIASASAVPMVGAIPRFVDTDPDTFNVDPAHLEDVITDDTVGVVGVHFAGYPMDLDRIVDIVEENDLFLIEDAAHAHGSEWRDRKVGTYGAFGTFSFQESKSMPTGEGGIVVTDDDVLGERARILHNIGRHQGETGYRHYKLSSNYRLSEIQAALGVGQLEALPGWNERMRRGEERLVEELAGVPGIVTKPDDDRITARGYCLFNVRFDEEAYDGVTRDRFLSALNAEGVPASDGYEKPIYWQPAFYREEVSTLVPPGSDIPDYRNLHLPGAEQVVRENISLSQRLLLADDEDLRLVGDAFRKVIDNVDDLRE